MGAHIKKAADLASQTQRDELQSARNSLVTATNAIVARVNSARDRDEQKLWNFGVAAGGIVIGILIAVAEPHKGYGPVQTGGRYENAAFDAGFVVEI